MEQKKSIVGVNELDLLVQNTECGEGVIVPLLDARKERVYYSIYEKKEGIKRVSEYKDGELRDLLEELRDKNVIFCGDGAIAYEKIIKEVLGEKAKIVSKGNSIPRSVLAGEMAIDMQEDNLYTLEPFYVNKSQAEREKGRKTKEKLIYFKNSYGKR